jgi:hypothetical protein
MIYGIACCTARTVQTCSAVDIGMQPPGDGVPLDPRAALTVGACSTTLARYQTCNTHVPVLKAIKHAQVALAHRHRCTAHCLRACISDSSILRSAAHPLLLCAAVAAVARDGHAEGAGVARQHVLQHARAPRVLQTRQAHVMYCHLNRDSAVETRWRNRLQEDSACSLLRFHGY